MKQVKVLFVCMGNICRSPTAHGIFQQLLDSDNLSDKILVDSAGTIGYHSGSPPEYRACSIAESRGVNLLNLTARKVVADDYLTQDYILVMDYDNLRNLESECPVNYRQKLELLLKYHPDEDFEEVPDPYYGGKQGFVNVYEMIEIACTELLEQIKNKYSL